MNTLKYLALLLALSSCVVSAETIYKNAFHPDEELVVNLKLKLNYKDGTQKDIIRDVGSFSYTPGRSFVMNTTLNTTNVDFSSGIKTSIIISKKGWRYGYKHGEIDLVFVQPNSTSKRLLLRGSSTQNNGDQQANAPLQWIPGINTFLSYEEKQYKELPRRYYLDKSYKVETIYSPDSTSTALLEPQSNYINLDGSEDVDLPIRLNITVIPVADAWKVALKVDMFLKSASHLSNNDLKDAQNMFLKVSPHYVKFLGVISFAHVILTFLSIKNDVNTLDQF